MQKTNKPILLKRVGLVAAIIIIPMIVIIPVLRYTFILPDLSKGQIISNAIREDISKARLKAIIIPSAENVGRLGMIFHSNGNYKEALDCYKLAIKKDKKNWKWDYYSGYLNRENGEMNEAYECFRRVVSIDSLNFMALYYLGESAENLNKKDEAEVCFKRLAGKNELSDNFLKPERENYFPVPTYAKFNLARIYVDSGKLGEAEKILKELIAEQITFGPSFRLLGNLYAKKGDSVLSKKYSVRAKDLADYTPPADPLTDKLMLISKSDVYLLKAIDQAVTYRNMQWALKLAEHSIKNISDNKYVISKAIKVFITTGNESRAFSLVEKHLEAFNNDFKELMEVANYFMNNGNRKIGILYFSAAKKAEPLNPSLALWLRKWSFNKEASSLIEEQTAKQPLDYELVSAAIMISMGAGGREKAKNYIARLGSIAPSNPEIGRNLGFLAYEEKNLDAAIRYWKEVLKKERKDVSTIRNLIKVYKQQQDWKELDGLLKKALEENPNDPFLLDEAGKHLVNCPDAQFKNLNDGIEYSERAFYHFYSNPEIKLSSAKNLAAGYAVLGDKKMAGRFTEISQNLDSRDAINRVSTAEL